MPDPTPFGLLNLYKPSGPTSHDIVARVRRGTRVKQIGHAGTLDPLATGVLVLCVGAATRLSEYVMGSPKTYRATIHFGVQTETYDAEGAVIARDPRPIHESAIRAALPAFTGPIEQLPPLYSAIKQGGRRLYDLARSGISVERKPRPVTIYALELLSWDPPLATLEVVCSPGTYIRSLAHDLGCAVGVGAHLAALERTASGHFTAAEAVHWADFADALAAETWRHYLLPADSALPDAAAVHLSSEQTLRVLHGNTIPAAAPGALARAYDPQGRFFAVLIRRGDLWQPAKVFHQ